MPTANSGAGPKRQTSRPAIGIMSAVVERRRRDRDARLPRGPAQHLLREEREQKHAAVEPDAHQRAVDAADRERAVAEHAQVDDRVLGAQLVPDEAARARWRRSAPGRRDESLSNQSSRLPRSSTVCSAPTPIDEQRDAEPVDALDAAHVPAAARADSVQHRNRGDDAERHVDVEDPRPRPLVRDPAAERRAEARAEHGADAEDRLARCPAAAAGTSRP